MVNFVGINKYGAVETLKMKSMDELYKKCKFRKKKDFDNRHSWILLMNNKHKIHVHVYAKNTGRPVSINKYELPPPIDKDLFYGYVGVVASKDKEMKKPMNLTKEMWGKIYEKLMGGFEDLGEEDESDEEEIPPELQTKQGYSKENDFVVDDDNIEYNTSSSSPSEAEYEFSDHSDDDDYLGNVEDDSVVKVDDKNSKDGESSEEDEIEEEELTDPDSELSEEEYKGEDNKVALEEN